MPLGPPKKPCPTKKSCCVSTEVEKPLLILRFGPFSLLFQITMLRNFYCFPHLKSLNCALALRPVCNWYHFCCAQYQVIHELSGGRGTRYNIIAVASNQIVFSSINALHIISRKLQPTSILQMTLKIQIFQYLIILVKNQIKF